MAGEQPKKTPDDPTIEQFARDLIDESARIRLPLLVSSQETDGLYRLPNRHGVSVIGATTSQLGSDAVDALMRFRLGQFLAAGHLAPATLYERREEPDLLPAPAPHDVHVVAGSAETGEIMCYASLKALPETPDGTTLHTADRPALSVEKYYGWGVYNRLPVLPDLPVTRLRELSNFVKNQRLHTFDEGGVRAPVEVGVAVFRLLIGPLRADVDAIIGYIEENVAKRNLDFFHTPTVLIHGTFAYVDDASPGLPVFLHGDHFPFAFLVSDLFGSVSRLEAIDRALALPGPQAMRALFGLKATVDVPRSNLEPAGGLAPLNRHEMPQRKAPMPLRREMRDIGERLRTLDLFASLSVPEVSVLGTLMERYAVNPGDYVVRQGEVGDALYVIESGQALVQITHRTGETEVVATLGPNDYFGEIAIVTGGVRTADVVAATPLVVLRLRSDDYVQYLAHIAEVEQQLSRTAATRAAATIRREMGSSS